MHPEKSTQIVSQVSIYRTYIKPFTTHYNVQYAHTQKYLTQAKQSSCTLEYVQESITRLKKVNVQCFNVFSCEARSASARPVLHQLPYITPVSITRSTVTQVLDSQIHSINLYGG